LTEKCKCIWTTDPRKAMDSHWFLPLQPLMTPRCAIPYWNNITILAGGIQIRKPASKVNHGLPFAIAMDSVPKRSRLSELLDGQQFSTPTGRYLPQGLLSVGAIMFTQTRRFSTRLWSPNISRLLVAVLQTCLWQQQQSHCYRKSGSTYEFFFVLNKQT
jgi:hypothetical protein